MKNTYNTNAAKISIAICTRERPQMLTTLLKSLESLSYLSNVSVTIDIIENQKEQNLAELIRDISKSIPVQTNHHWEPKLGIPIARNTALKVAKESGATHIIFIDDDEYVDPLWLTNLWATYLQFNETSIIQGPVISSIKTEKNKHLHKEYQRRLKTTGEHLDVCATNNVLIPLKSLDDHQLLFDESRPLAGGTDSKLFRKAHTYGIPMRYCAEAIVYEDIPNERISLSWLSRRHFRIGLSMGQHQKESGTESNYLKEQTWESIRNLTRALSYLIRFNREKSDKRWLRSCKAAGKTLGYFNVTIDSYRKIDGN